MNPPRLTLREFAAQHGLADSEVVDHLLARKGRLATVQAARLRDGMGWADPPLPDALAPRPVRDFDLVREAKANLELAVRMRDAVFRDDGTLVGTAKDAQNALAAVDKVIATAAKHYQDMHNASSVMALEEAAKEAMEEMGPEASRRFLDILDTKTRALR